VEAKNALSRRRTSASHRQGHLLDILLAADERAGGGIDEGRSAGSRGGKKAAKRGEDARGQPGQRQPVGALTEHEPGQLPWRATTIAAGTTIAA